MNAIRREDRDNLINPASRHDPNLAWFRKARQGLFIHTAWGRSEARFGLDPAAQPEQVVKAPN